MTRYVLEMEVDKVVEAMEVMLKKGMEAAIFGSLLHVTVDNIEKTVPQIKKVLKESDITLTRIERIMPSLEDVFVTLIETS